MVAAFALVVGSLPAPGLRGGDKVATSVHSTDFGKTPDGIAVELYELTNAAGMKVKIMTYGGIITELHTPDRTGKLGDVVLGFDDLAGYVAGHPYFGAIVGRVANRIARGEFALDGKEYKLAVNNGPNALHGGLNGFDKVVWKAKALQVQPEASAVQLYYRSPAGEEGYPGNLDATVTYTLTEDNMVLIDYRATADKPTAINLTNHSYFNLAGPASGDVLGHEMMIAADRYTPVDDTLIPTGKIDAVRGTPMDFTTPTAIGARIGQLKGEPGGYDHNYVLRREGKSFAKAVRVYEPMSGRVMEMWTTEPGVQFYSGNFLDGKIKGKGGVVYRKHQGICLEAQHFPDSVHHPNFPSVILRPGETYTQATGYRFSAR
jgi:aldose 1-epimerase